jgi:pimeloyl-ACP methyl ester carboxylesterase
VESAHAPVVVVGHSMGGMVIQTLARRHPDLFGRLIVGAVLINTTYTNPLRTMILAPVAQALRPVLEVALYLQIGLLPISWLSAWQSYLSGSTHMANRLGFGRHVTRGQLDHVSLLSARNSPASQARGNLAMFRWDATEAVANISIPLLILAGDGDIVTKPEASRQMADLAALPELHVISGSNHFSFLDHSREYNSLVAEYSAKVFAAMPASGEAPLGDRRSFPA